MMETINFTFLQKDYPDLAELGGFAEQYAVSDPASAVVKLRVFGEQLTKVIYQRHRLPFPYSRDFSSLLTANDFQNTVSKVICDKLHALRKNGNVGAHGGKVQRQTALWLLKEAYQVGAWLGVQFLGLSFEQLPQFIAPKPADNPKKLRKELDQQFERLSKLMEEHDQLKSSYEAVQREKDEQAELYAKSQAITETLGFSEEETRKRLIDTALASVGWNLEDENQVTQEEEVDGQPTKSGKGFADYVLWGANGKPLAVIEAKKTAKDANAGRKQAVLYADSLEKRYEQRPVIFYTNGHEINIWDDAGGYKPRKLFGFYSRNSLEYLIFQRREMEKLDTVAHNPEIAGGSGRLYQVEAIRRVNQRFAKKERKVLIVQATGTGKTRVAIALSDVLLRAKWVRRVLFLCDRRELRKQAKNAYAEHLNEPISIVQGKLIDGSARIYLATYPAMAKVFQSFDPGYFDLVIADESHRSVYNIYGDLFKYFDALQVGLTATPVEFINRNTYGLFGCGNQDPTAYYSLKKAIKEQWLTPYEVFPHTTDFLRKGIKYDELTNEQKEQLEEDGVDPESLFHEAGTIDKQIYNKDTNRLILRNLMDNGLRDATGQHPGKTIIFARNHRHALLLQEMFDELYPQYGGRFCQVIDNYDPRAEQLIDDFKGEGSNDELTIAISVDMLDTGIDVPEIVNLVFAKPVRSKVKFWQMIGRGTRLCPDLYGPGEDKTVFRIFDHWQNFEDFSEDKPEAEPSSSRPLMQQLLEARITLGDQALQAALPDSFKWIAALLLADVKSLPGDTISVKEKWREVETVSANGKIEQFAPATVQLLRNEIAPLMQWVAIRGQVPAYRFDLLIARLQTALLQKSSAFEDLKGELINQLHGLQMNLNQVRAKADMIRKVREDDGFWTKLTIEQLEEVRLALRAIMQYRDSSRTGGTPLPRIIDVEDGGIETGQISSGIKSIDLAAYRKRVEEPLKRLAQSDPTLQKIKAGEPVNEADLQALTALILNQNPDIDLNLLKALYKTAEPVEHILRSIIGMDIDAVRDLFSEFVVEHPSLNPKQVQFLTLLQDHIACHGAVELDELWEAPFDRIDEDGVEGLFAGKDLDELLELIDGLAPPKPKEEANI